jgi:hypothetical protein
MYGAGIGHALRFALRGGGALNGEPNDVGAQLRVADFFEHQLLDFGGPPKALPSSGVHKQQQTHVAHVAVESVAELRGFRRERCHLWGGTCAAAEKKQAREERGDDKQDGEYLAHRFV